jgi:hypothetical protein
MNDAATRFAALFPGFTRAHGVFRAHGTDERGKVKGRAVTVAGPVDYAAHLEGREPQGAIPLLDDCTVQWGAIDVDQYDIDIADIACRIAEHRLPLIPCASKSGGVHLYTFLREPGSADALRRWLSASAAKLGVGGSEVFPKQSTRANAQDIGNWINLPYWRGEERCAWHDGRWLTLEEFLTLAEDLRHVVPVSAPRKKRTTAAPDDPLDGCPPCLRHHLEAGVPDGHKHEHLFTLIVYARKRWPDEWKARVHELQRLLFKPPLSYEDVERNFKSISRKEYDYECKGPWCDRGACRTAAYGSGTTSGDVIDSITKLVGDPVLWAVELGGQRVLVTSEQLQSQRQFNRLCMDVLSRCPAAMPEPRWLAYVDRKLQEADVVESPHDASPRGVFDELLAHYVASDMRRAQEREELLLGKVWLEDGWYHFRSVSFFSYLDERRFRYREHNVWQWLRDAGAQAASVTVNGKRVSVWRVQENTT